MRATVTRGDGWATRITVNAVGLGPATTYTADLRRTADGPELGPVVLTEPADNVLDLALDPAVTAALPPRAMLNVRAHPPDGRRVTILTVELFADDAA